MTVTGETTTADSGGIRNIDTTSAPTRFARGWHCLGLARDFRDGQPHSIEAFGEKLVIWQDSHGKLNVLNAYCRHMGGDLSDGTIKGDDVACPFHDWRWGGDGRCTTIPYARRVPLRARTQAWSTMERNGQLFIWNDPEGAEPEDYIPHIGGVGSDGWTDWIWNSITIDANCREIVDNVVDMAHFFYVHYAFPRQFRNIFEGPVATQYMESTARQDMVESGVNYGDPNSRLQSEASYFGPSYMINWLVSEAQGTTIETTLINCHYPVTPDKFVLQYGLIVKKPEGMSDTDATAMAQQSAESVREGFEQDVAIWRAKERINNPLLSEQDGPVYQLRRWYEQFYVNRADITEDMTRRFEFEVDTSKANEYWESEVADNLARQEHQSGLDTDLAPEKA